MSWWVWLLIIWAVISLPAAVLVGWWLGKVAEAIENLARYR